MMLDYQRDGERTRWREANKTIVFLLAAALVIFAASGVGAQEKGKETASLSSGQVISLNINQMDLQDVLRLIAEKADLNIIMGKEVTGVVSLRLKNVDLWQALEVILEVTGFSYRKKDGIIRVVKLEKLAEEKPALVTEIILLKYAKAEEIKKICQYLLSPSGTIETDIQANALIIKDIGENIEKVRQLVAKLDTGAPMFNLKGILSTPDYSLAMINNIILKTGETIGGFTVSEIGEDSVTLKRDDQSLTLRLRGELDVLEK